MKNKFVFDSGSNEYIASINAVKISIRQLSDDLIAYAEKLFNEYNSNLDNIAEFILSSNAFDNETGIYKKISKDKLLKSLGAPYFRLTSNNHCEVVYYNHTLDKENIISFEVGGVYNKLGYLSING